ncbi:MAG: hypothetical protein FWC87_01095 [Acidimicrobiaceae bacterium]|nr:hypothetical protein [Acidimicrobiaceae bacterium]
MFSPRNILGVIGIMLGLIALYLLLENGGQASKILGALSAGSIGIFTTLQGRTTNFTGSSGAATSVQTQAAA